MYCIYHLTSASDPSKWETVATLTGHTDYVMSMSWSPDGSRAITGGGDETVRIHNHGTNRISNSIRHI